MFIYILVSILIYFIINLKKYKKFIPNYILAIIVSLAILTPHFFWLFENDFVTIFYGLNRSAVIESELINNFKNPLIFLTKQMIILLPFIAMIFLLLKKIKLKLKLNIKLPNHLENHLPAFEATHSSSDIHGNVNKKGEINEVSTKKTR